MDMKSIQNTFLNVTGCVVWSISCMYCLLFSYHFIEIPMISMFMFLAQSKHLCPCLCSLYHSFTLSVSLFISAFILFFERLFTNLPALSYISTYVSLHFNCPFLLLSLWSFLIWKQQIKTYHCHKANFGS